MTRSSKKQSVQKLRTFSSRACSSRLGSVASRGNTNRKRHSWRCNLKTMRIPLPFAKEAQRQHTPADRSIGTESLIITPAGLPRMLVGKEHVHCISWGACYSLLGVDYPENSFQGAPVPRSTGFCRWENFVVHEARSIFCAVWYVESTYPPGHLLDPTLWLAA